MRAAILLVALLFAAAVGAVHVNSEDLGAKYCGSVEKKYGFYRAYEGHVNGEISKYYYIKVYGIIDQGTEEYIDYAISIAEEEGAGLIILLDTPGGYLDAATNIVARINRARIPVIAFVVEKWAESAGTMIVVTSHVAAMQPGTIIGSMQPVLYDPQSGVYKPVNESKIINPIIKILCEHGATKGRNATALVGFVLKNYNFGAEEALRYDVIDVVANDTYDLVRKISGGVVVLPSGEAYRLSEGPLEELRPPLRAAALHALSDPILSGLLMSIGTLVIIFSIVSGHLAFATIGLLLLLLGLAGTGYNPNLVSVVLIIVGSILLAVEIHTPGFGVFGVTGILMIMFGVILLPTGGGFAVSESYANTMIKFLYSIAAALGGLAVFIVYKLVEVKRRKPVIWTIVGSVGRALDDIPPGGEGFVFVEGEYWKATSDEYIRRGDRVVVVGKEGPVLIVKKAEASSPGRRPGEPSS